MTCAAPPPTPPAIIRRAVTPSPLVQRPVLRLSRKPAQSVKVLCDPPQGAEPQPPMQASDRADALPVVAMLPAVPTVKDSLIVEPLSFDPPSAGPAPERTWTLASHPAPSWWAPPAVLVTAPVPGVPEPGTLLLAGLGVLAVLGWTRARINASLSGGRRPSA